MLESAGSLKTGMMGRQSSLQPLEVRFQADRTTWPQPPPPSPTRSHLASLTPLPATRLLQLSGRTSFSHPFSRLILTVKVALGLVSSLLGLKRRKTQSLGRRCDVLESVHCPALQDLLLPPWPPSSVPNTGLLFDKAASCFYNLIGRSPPGHPQSPGRFSQP